MIYFHTKYVAPLMFNTTYIFFLQLYILGAVNSTVFLAMLNEYRLLGVSLILFLSSRFTPVQRVALKHTRLFSKHH